MPRFGDGSIGRPQRGDQILSPKLTADIAFAFAYNYARIRRLVRLGPRR
jgi:hypothetical protein